MNSVLLLAEVGQVLHGSDWRKLLSADVGVVGAAMDRYAAGVTEVPSHVWRDLSFRLENKAIEANELRHRIAALAEAVR